MAVCKTGVLSSTIKPQSVDFCEGWMQKSCSRPGSVSVLSWPASQQVQGAVGPEAGDVLRQAQGVPSSP
eukprot:CAMPEP_0206427604 /NCGR_PEP_ID=MMETSP0324_2-20121206/5140_1 /ASSEMBLY_ACC=CAM_ASM_000836 /TAXON_ID=2866 /ORGANISM="Crypthecodinium cohnii, Strain Seligo" /LENGTH=68 /DNA_ID=CAMNT_0053892917 /DNA_START=531 /DNA_END=733 /DNA_ORIENTATION=+